MKEYIVDNYRSINSLPICNKQNKDDIRRDTGQASIESPLQKTKKYWIAIFLSMIYFSDI